MSNTSPDAIVSANLVTYDTLANEYEQKAEVRAEYNRLILSRFAGHIGLAQRSVLDLGCAVGVDSRILLDMGYSVTGVENSPNMAVHARLRCPEADIQVADFMKWETRAKFDAILAQAFIHLFPMSQAQIVLDKIYNLLKPAGIVLVTTTSSDVSSEGWVEKQDYTGGHRRFRKNWTKDEMLSAMFAAKLAIIDDYELTDPYAKSWMLLTGQKPGQ